MLMDKIRLQAGDKHGVGNMKKKAIICVCAILAVFFVMNHAGFLSDRAAAETLSAARPKPTVRPQTVPFDHTLPAVRLTDENVLKYFNIELGKEYSRGKKLSVPFSVSPKEPYDEYAGSSRGVAIRLELSVFLTEEDEEPYLTKSYIVMLRRQTRYRAAGTIDVLLKLDQDDIFYTWKVIGSNGRIGPVPEEDLATPAPAPEAETET